VSISLNIITVVRNDLQSLLKTIDNIQAFNFNEGLKLKHIIVDGLSTDGTWDVISELSKSLKIETILISEADQGIYDAMNKGVARYKCDFTLFVNAGDEVTPFITTEDFVKSLEKCLCDMKVAGSAYSCYYKFNNKSIKIAARKVGFERMPSLHQGIVYKREKLLDFPYVLKYKICGDYHNWCELRSSYNFHIHSPVLATLDAGGTSTMRPLILFKESLEIYRRFVQPSTLKLTIHKLNLFLSLCLTQILYRVMNIFR
jgi:putative colanic acid biosynthesis glycosyltransferase